MPSRVFKGFFFFPTVGLIGGLQRKGKKIFRIRGYMFYGRNAFLSYCFFCYIAATAAQMLPLESRPCLLKLISCTARLVDAWVGR